MLRGNLAARRDGRFSRFLALSRATSVTRVLVVDDDDGIRSFVSLALADDGYEVAEASNGEAALRTLQEVPTDVILLDIRMPTIDGWEFSRIYRQTPGAAREDHCGDGSAGCGEVGSSDRGRWLPGQTLRHR